MDMRVDQAEPAAPAWAAARRAGARQVVGDRMPPALRAQLRIEAFLLYIAVRLGRQDLALRRAVEAHRRPGAGTGRLEERAALAHIAHDIVEIGLRDHPAPAVAVEDDQVELVELDVEQLADRKRDQRQLADRRAVLLFRRAQDREVDKI